MIEFIILDIELITNNNMKHKHEKYQLAEVQIAKISDFGSCDTQFQLIYYQLAILF